ncbi:MAG: hypothetical protein ACC662_11540 [Planctomycetota bacterium]
MSQRTYPVLMAGLLVVVGIWGIRGSLAGEASEATPKPPPAGGGPATDHPRKKYTPISLPYAEQTLPEVTPPPDAPPRFVVNLRPSGALRFKGYTWSLGTGSVEDQANALVNLRHDLESLTANPRWREADHSSKVALMIYGDRNARWQYVSWILQICADPRIQIYRLQFAVRPPPTGEKPGRNGRASTDRRIDFELPRNGSWRRPSAPAESRPTITVKLFRRPPPPGSARSEPATRIVIGDRPPLSLPPGSWTGLEENRDGRPGDRERWKRYAACQREIVKILEALRAKHGDDAKIQGEIKTPPPYGQAVPHGDVILVLDAFHEAGIQDVIFEGAVPPVFHRGNGRIIKTD